MAKTQKEGLSVGAKNGDQVMVNVNGLPRVGKVSSVMGGDNWDLLVRFNDGTNIEVPYSDAEILNSTRRTNYRQNGKKWHLAKS